MEKRIVSLVLMALLVLLGSNTAWAEGIQHAVSPGETLSGISLKYHGTANRWKEIAQDNGVADPHKLQIGQVLKIKKQEESLRVISPQGEKRSVSAPSASERSGGFRWQYAGGDPYKGTFEEALSLLEFPAEAKNALRKVNLEGNFQEVTLRNGDELAAMTFGQNRVEAPVILDIKNLSEDGLPARKYVVETGGIIYSLYYPYICGNWSRGFDKFSEKDIVITPSEPKVVYRVSVPVYEELPAQWAIEHEPIVGAFIWGTDMASGGGAYAEYIGWLRKVDPYTGEYYSGWSPGLGIFGTYSRGSVKDSDYRWKEYFIGPEVGLKYIAVDDSNRPWQWQAKLRVGREWMRGKNPTSGYQMNQDNWKAGIYTEYVRRESEEWMWGLTGEGWWAFDKKIDSTWAGDTAQSRTSLAAHVFAQRKLNENWQARVSPGIFYQDWDYLTGFKLLGELRYKETLMFGTWWSYPLHLGGGVYDGIASASDLSSIGAFVRLELGAYIRNRRADQRAAEVNEIHFQNDQDQVDWRQNLAAKPKGGEEKEEKRYDW